MTDGDLKVEPIFRNQKIGVLSRNGLYWAGRTSWVEKVEHARVYPINMLVIKARIDVGMPCELLHVVPMINPAIDVEIVGEDRDQSFNRSRSNALGRVKR